MKRETTLEDTDEVSHNFYLLFFIKMAYWYSQERIPTGMYQPEWDFYPYYEPETTYWPVYGYYRDGSWQIYKQQVGTHYPSEMFRRSAYRTTDGYPYQSADWNYAYYYNNGNKYRQPINTYMQGVRGNAWGAVRVGRTPAEINYIDAHDWQWNVYQVPVRQVKANYLRDTAKDIKSKVGKTVKKAKTSNAKKAK